MVIYNFQKFSKWKNRSRIFQFLQKVGVTTRQNFFDKPTKHWFNNFRFFCLKIIIFLYKYLENFNFSSYFFHVPNQKKKKMKLIKLQLTQKIFEKFSKTRLKVCISWLYVYDAAVSPNSSICCYFLYFKNKLFLNNVKNRRKNIYKSY